ncbi:MAG: bifunctional diguanylate cyclase/phosphodiesterase [Acetatifactor sp.]|nr:bifunctional diguanylate cyclase/phosphodiesterase [Acetatifactor sp.]
MQSISQGVIDYVELQRLQQDFCQQTRLCVYCLDSKGQRITEISGSREQVERIQELSKLPQVNTALERVWEDSLEDLAIEELNADGDMVAAVAVRVNGKTLVYWMAFMIRPGKDAVSAFFCNTLDLLQDASSDLFSGKFTGFGEAADISMDSAAGQEMSRSYKNTVALARMIQMLDSEERVEILAQKWLELLGSHLQVDTAQLYQLNYESGTMDVLCEWLNEGQHSIYERIGRLKIPRYLRTQDTMCISSDTTDVSIRKYLKEWKLQALIQISIISKEGEGSLVLSLNHRKRHIWTMEETMYAEDAVRVLHSVLKRRMQQAHLRSSYKALETVLDNVGCSIYVKHAKEGSVLFTNSLFKRTFGSELKDGTFEPLLQRGIEIGQDTGIYEVHHTQKNRWYDLTFKEVAWVDGAPALLYALYDITDKRLYQIKIEQQAYTDFLTGLFNRMCCERDLARQVDRARKSGQTGALLYMDLDDFKHINDGLGHQYGDVLLKAISHSLQRIPGIENNCYRMGGDEFVIVVPPDGYGEVDRIVDDIKGIFARPWFLKDADYYCTMSMGIVVFPDGGESVTDLVKKADIALLEAKRSGKNRVVNYREGLQAVSGRRLDMERNMRDATAAGYEEFEVYYQPIIDVQDGIKCAGAEALVRWNSSKLGFIPPAEFIPLAEYLGLINPIGNYVLKEACTQCHKWNESGYPDYKVNVNLSVVQLLQTDIVDIVKCTIEETGIRPRNLVLEVTESLAINDMVRMKEILNRIKALGVRIALDDFGTGYSSLNHIREIPLDLIKVDQSFVQGLAEDAYSQSFIKMVSELAGTLGVDICVEGIETAAQYNVVKDMKVKYIQGYYFDRPMRCRDFEQKYVAKTGESM